MQAKQGGGLDDTLRDFWATRPRRPKAGRKVAGVATGIGQRYGIDPVLVRIAFVVATIAGGVGVLLYLVGWLLLPEEGDEVSALEGLAKRGRSSVSAVTTILLLIALLPASGAVFGPGGPSGWLVIALAAAGLYLLHQNRGAENRERYLATAASAPPAEAAPPATGPTPPAYPTGEFRGAYQAGAPAGARSPAHEPEAPPTWDPLGVAPFAWDLPEPAPVGPTEPPRRQSRVTLVTLGLALVAGGIAIAVASQVPAMTVSHVIGVVLGVLGLGMVFGSFLQGGRGLIPLAIPVGAAAVITSVLPLGAWPGAWHGIGDERFTPRTVAEAKAGDYRLSVGDLRVDLSELPLGAGEELRKEINVGLGNVRVLVPANAEVAATCSAKIGDITCLDQRNSGLRKSTRTHQEGSGGGKVVLDVRAGTGNVEVGRG
ncbi:PspC domain-containing protein [Longimycelium tulufanense]|nr:PspC domain-containing protein [Longimycelium tulufanense]